MLTAQLLQTVQDMVLVAAPSAPPAEPAITNVNTQGILTWVATYIAPVIVAVTGVAILNRARGGHVSQVVTTTGITILGVVVMAAAPVLFVFGDVIVDLVFATK